MNNFNIPIFKKLYDLYKTLNNYYSTIPKEHRFNVYQRCENIALDVLEAILLASSRKKDNKLLVLEQASVKLNMLRVFVRLLKDTRAINLKKYIVLQSMIDEIGRMLGGWIRSLN